jgi:ppGpp synthetase/RelA/SpoT-type nucleotidyltranferase
MTPDAFATWYDHNAPAYKAWGEYVRTSVIRDLENHLQPKRFSGFLKIAPAARLKEKESAVAKVGRKGYEKPDEQMTDIVGIRFVVLVSTDIDEVVDVLRANPTWVTSEDRHPVEEARQDPSRFDYASAHYVVRPSEDLMLGQTTVPTTCACEVQIRTLLQHAWAEMMHENVYKTTAHIPLSAKRLMSRASALAETTDEVFRQLLQTLQQVSRDREAAIDILRQRLGAVIAPIQPIVESELDRVVWDTFRHLCSEISAEQIAGQVESVRFYKTQIQRRAADAPHGLFAHPVCLLSYWLVQNFAAELDRNWPVPAYRDDLDKVFADCGVAPVRR